jgi:CHAT domain-containing protein
MRGKARDAEAPMILQGLYRRLWAPIEPLLPAGTKTVIFSPDGALNFVSFATLLTPDDQFLSQKYSIRYVASGRDLLREFQPSPSPQLMVFADPEFERPDTSGPRAASREGQPAINPESRIPNRDSQDWRALRFYSLLGTAKEGAALQARAKEWNWPTKVFARAEATEAQLQATRSPRVLHLATHGFFLPETATTAADEAAGVRGTRGIIPDSEFGSMREPGGLLKPRVRLKNPMHRSGLALAGAQSTLEAWKRGEVPATDNDGIVTAEEVGLLKLDGTWLVTLSACNTGAGEARSGEGVLGLRRGFIQAGAQNLLMTLWAVSDEETAWFMVDFYEAAHKTGNAPQALADVQRDWLVRLRKERGLAVAVIRAGPFILTAQGPMK